MMLASLSWHWVFELSNFFQIFGKDVFDAQLMLQFNGF